MGLIELGEIMMTSSERRLEIVSQNIANTSTPGYKTTETFEQAIDGAAFSQTGAARVTTNSNFAQGALRQTNNPLDLAISGAGMFMMRADNHTYYTRNGQFTRNADGRVTNAQGMTLQAANGGDLVLSDAPTQILDDGSVIENGVPVARIGVFEPDDPHALQAQGGSLYTASEDAMRQVGSPLIRQGMLESANVDTAAEMVAMMSTMRQAEAGARVVEAYDTLMNQSITTFSRSPK